jgi:two-component system, NarL family, nitrate/nitrite response regulator NarL
MDSDISQRSNCNARVHTWGGDSLRAAHAPYQRGDRRPRSVVLLSAEGCFEIVASCSDGTSCIEAIRKLVPDIAILDISIPGLTGLEILNTANFENIYTRLVFFTASIEDRELVMSAAAEDAHLEILVQSLRQIADGQRLLPLPADQTVSLEQSNIAVTDNALTVLTDRERRIMRLVSEGLSNKEIGRRLNIADGTIKQHLHHIYQKLEISNQQCSRPSPYRKMTARAFDL